MTDEAGRLAPVLEALLFSSGKPIAVEAFAEMLESDAAAVEDTLKAMAERTNAEDRGIRLEAVGGGWRFVTRPEFDGVLRKYFEISERSRLSLAALETLAIIAYRQPITAPEISELRGVNSSAVLKTLFDKKLITTAGKKPVVGTPFLYKTTKEFLIRFGLNDLAELPRPEEIDEDLAAAALDDGAPLSLVPPIADETGISETDPGPEGSSPAEAQTSLEGDKEPSEPVSRP
jgi:segregation and condensation protein B